MPTIKEVIDDAKLGFMHPPEVLVDIISRMADEYNLVYDALKRSDPAAADMAKKRRMAFLQTQCKSQRLPVENSRPDFRRMGKDRLRQELSAMIESSDYSEDTKKFLSGLRDGLDAHGRLTIKQLDAIDRTWKE